MSFWLWRGTRRFRYAGEVYDVDRIAFGKSLLLLCAWSVIVVWPVIYFATCCKIKAKNLSGGASRIAGSQILVAYVPGVFLLFSSLHSGTLNPNLTMLTILQLIAVLALGYLSAHFLIGKLQSKFFFASGIEYILLGVLIGPNATNLMTPDVVRQLNPFISVSIGSLGLLYGLQLRIRDLAKVHTESYRLLFSEFLTTQILVTGIFAIIFYQLFPNDKDNVGIFSGALVLGTSAAISAPTAIRAVRKRFKAKGPATDMLDFVIRFDQLLGIVFFGLIFCFYHIGQTHGIRALTTTEWLAVNIGIGIVLGLLFYLFLGKEESENKLLLGILGIVVFSSGAAYYLNLSPLFINLILGVMLANTSKIHKKIIEVLHSVEKPFYAVILVFAGAAWNWDSYAERWPLMLQLVLFYLVIRYFGKLLGGQIAHTASEAPELLLRRIGTGLLSQGGVAVAMVVNYQQVYQNNYTAIVMTCVLISVVFYEWWSHYLTQKVLVDANEIESRALTGK